MIARTKSFFFYFLAKYLKNSWHDKVYSITFTGISKFQLHLSQEPLKRTWILSSALKLTKKKKRIFFCMIYTFYVLYSKRSAYNEFPVLFLVLICIW